MKQVTIDDRGVRFQESAEVLSRSPQAEDPQMWYSSSDLQSVREESKSTLKAFKKVGFNATALDEDTHCLRGLEHFQKHGGVREKKSRTRSLIQGVLDEQFNQRQMGITDPKGLQVLASACSKQARERALFAAKNDEKEVKEMFYNDLQESSWSSLSGENSACSCLYSEKSSELSDEDQKLTDSVRTKLNLKDRKKKSSNARSA
eukprot:CAMPEP_0119004132 /NCGR_PEP_ID=MMETSP1176-20130426/971_1 /TAXON_ID=265551 /ORGANISM="Synedropsis recta cf, Strain CCMP1620" /LENGTH=203 /DNA_ID=CAMNT_0006955809 /DNA_START=170 /DNA_END=781 /DNA_ORIENTATION=+